MKVTTDSCFFGAWAAKEMENGKCKMDNVLDIGAGTGLLSLMIAQKNNVHIDAVEINKDAAVQARENIVAAPWKERIQLYNENILSFASSVKYDCIISNPPFYENELTSSIHEKNIAHHSEELTMQETLSIIKKRMKDDGIFFLMYPFKREKKIEAIFAKQSLFVAKKIYLKQSVNHSPFRILIKGCKKVTEAETFTTTVRNEKQQYTSEFVGLLKDYYLYL